jgi:hypothetical protein
MSAHHHILLNNILKRKGKERKVGLSGIRTVRKLKYEVWEE